MICAGKDATKDGSILVGHTDDAGDGASDLRLVNVPAMDYPPNSLRPVYSFNNGNPRVVTNDRGAHYQSHEQNQSKPLGYIPQVEHTFAYFDQDYGMMNEKQLAIGESTCGAKTVGWPSDVSYGFNMMGIAELTKIALERCESARCAIQTMGDLAVEYGFFSEDSGNPNNPGYGDSAEALGIGDKFGEIWIFHVMTGLKNTSAIWAAMRIPDEHVSVLANGFVIREINTKDPENYMWSSNIFDAAIELGWWNPNSGKNFDFTAVYGYDGDKPFLPLYVGRRTWRVFDFVAPSLKLDSTIGYSTNQLTYPISVKPDTLIDTVSIMDLLKDYYKGTPYDMSKGITGGPFNMPIRYDGPSYNMSGGWERPISMFRTMFSFVLVSRGGFPDAIGGVVWFGQASPHGTVYVPFSCAQKSIPDSYLAGKESEFDLSSAWWAFSFVNNWSYTRYSIISLDVQAEQKRLQAEAFKHNKNLEKRSLKSKFKGTENLVEFLEKENNNFATSVVNNWWKLAWRLIGKYSDGYITTSEKQQDMTALGYPKEWLESDSQYMKWPGNSYIPQDDKILKPVLKDVFNKVGTNSSKITIYPLSITCIVVVSVIMTIIGMMYIIFRLQPKSKGYLALV